MIETEQARRSEAQTRELNEILRLANDKVEEVSQQNQALVLQRKNLLQAKESTSREMEKLLKQIEQMRHEQATAE